MTAERDALAKEFFARALELPPEEREAFLESRCADDAMRVELRSLLAHHDSAGGEFLESPAALVPDAIGPYKVVRIVGQGGFGAVYEALQERPVQRRVAVKVLRAGMDTRDVVARFAAERQLLALMTHPGIARVFDAGATEQGRPYVVMEFVTGAPITRFCDENQLDIRARLALFIDVCHAVQHAHQKSIIHRDLKPSNILVDTLDNHPAPKVIDFGIAKALDEGPAAPLVTRRGQVIGTPGYMSPEQVRADDVDTRSDIYSLGAVLYELLSGVPPFDPLTLARASPAQLERLMTDAEPAAPSSRIDSGSADGARSRTLRGDLDAIVLKAMDAERDRRYDTVGGLAADLQRYLNNEPVLARPASRAYRVRKFARRHRAAVTAAVGISAAVILGLAAAIYGLVQASRQRDQAIRETRILTGVVGFVNNDMLRAADPKVALRRDVTVREALEAASKSIEGKFPEEPLVEAAIRLTIGEIQRTLGRNEDAAPQIERAIEIRTARLGAQSPETLAAIRELGVVRDEQGREGEAQALFQRVLDGRRKALGEDHEATVQAMDDLAIAQTRGGLFESSETNFRQALAAHRRIHGAEHVDTYRSMNNLATALLARGKVEEALELASVAAPGYIRLAGPDDRVSLDCRNTLGLLTMLVGRPEEAEPILRDTLERRRGVLEAEHLAVADSLGNLAECLCVRRAGAGSGIEAETLVRECLRIRESRRPAGHWTILYARSLLGEALLLQRRFEEAEPLILSSYEALRDSPEARPDRKQAAARRVLDLYTTWDKPDQVGRWKSRIEKDPQSSANQRFLSPDR